MTNGDGHEDEGHDQGHDLLRPEDTTTLEHAAASRHNGTTEFSLYTAAYGKGSGRVTGLHTRTEEQESKIENEQHTNTKKNHQSTPGCRQDRLDIPGPIEGKELDRVDGKKDQDILHTVLHLLNKNVNKTQFYYSSSKQKERAQLPSSLPIHDTAQDDGGEADVGEQYRSTGRPSQNSKLLTTSESSLLHLLPTALDDLGSSARRKALRGTARHSPSSGHRASSSNGIFSVQRKDVKSIPLDDVSPRRSSRTRGGAAGPAQHTRATSGNTPETSFRLEYSEASLAVLSEWSRPKQTKHSRGRSRKRPCEAPIFRKCQLCSCYGHYEIECSKMSGEEALQLASQTSRAISRFELQASSKKQIGEHAGLSRSKKGAGEAAVNVGTLTGDHPEDQLPVLKCKVCEFEGGEDRMLICDGCEKLYHTFCVIPPVETIPQGEWLCPECQKTDEHVSSDVEIEVYHGYVLEQRKRPRSSALGDTRDRRTDSSWQTAVAILKDTSEEEEQRKNGMGAKHHRNGNGNSGMSVIEETQIDDLVIRASARLPPSYDVAALDDDWNYYHSPAAEKNFTLEEDLTPGAFVAWFPGTLEDSKAAAAAASEVEPLVGHVLAVDSEKRMALVQRFDDWKEVLSPAGSTSQVEPERKAPPRLWAVDVSSHVHAVRKAATLWYPVDHLHVVARAAPSAVEERCRCDTIPNRVETTRALRSQRDEKAAVSRTYLAEMK